MAQRGVSAPTEDFSSRALLLTAVWTAGWLGFAEAGLLTFARYRLDRYTHVSPQNIWMTPLFYMLVAAIAAVVVLGMWSGGRATRTRVVLFIPAWLGAIGVLMLLTRLHQLAVLVLALGIAVQYVRLVAARPAATLRLIRPTAWLGVVIVAGAFVVLNGGRALRESMAGSTRPIESGPNVLLIILDTVRAASMSVYGNVRNTTPHLAERARTGVVFENAFSPAPWTLPAHASMFTGLWPNQLSADWSRPLDSSAPTLAEVFAANGYHTAGFVGNTFYASRESGLARGFHHYEAYPAASAGQFMLASSIARTLMRMPGFRRLLHIEQDPGRRHADRIRRSFLAWQREHADRPFFAFLNLYDAHAPYLPPAPFDTLFGPRLPGRDPSMREGRTFRPEELQAEIDAYDGSIAFLDDQLRLLFQDLEHQGLLDNTLIVVTSDHGEEFGEHGVFTHGNSLYRQVVHVPLLMFFPGRVPAGHRVSDWVSTRDLPSTIMDLAGVTGEIPGRSLARKWNGGTGPDTLLALLSHASGRPASYPVSRGDMIAVMAQPYRYIRNGDGSRELYDLANDSVENRNIIDEPSAAAVRGGLTLTLVRWLDRSPLR